MKKITTLLLVLFVTIQSFSQTVIAKWTFEAITTVNTGTAPTFAASSNVADLGAQTAGSAFTALHASGATSWTNPAGNGSTKSVSANTWAVGDYFQFLVNTTGFTGISLTFDQLGSGTGPANFKVQYSTDGTTFTDFGNYTIPNNGAASPAAFTWASGTAITQTTFHFNLSSISAINNFPTVYFRLTDISTTNIVGGVVGTGGTGRVDNFAVTLTPSLAVADNGAQPAAGTIVQSSTKNILQTFSLTEGGIAANTLTQVKVPMSGNYLTSDITNFKLYANATNDFSTATSISTKSSANATGSGELVYFDKLSYALALSSTYYFWVTVDASATANTARNINASALTGNNFTYAIGPASGAVAAGGSQIFASVLPITLQNFTVNKNGNNAELHWLVDCSSTSVTFELQRSADALNFQTFYTSSETKARCAAPFNYTDANALSGKNFYRLKIIDVDGKISYSNIVSILNGIAGKGLLTIRPTVVSSQADVYYTSSSAEKIQWTIVDMQGRIVKKVITPVINGENKLAIPTADLPTGQYQLKGLTSAGSTSVVKFVKQ